MTKPRRAGNAKVIPLPSSEDKRATGRPSRGGRSRAITATRQGLAKGYQEFIAKAADGSKLVPDPFYGSYGTQGDGLTAIEPVYSFDKLHGLFMASTVLRQCVEAYAVNIDGYGHLFEYVGPEGEEDSTVAQTEHAQLYALFDRPNPSISLIELRKKFRLDLHTYGCGFIEGVRDNSGQITELHHAPAFTIRMTGHDKEPTEVVKQVRTPNGTVVERRMLKRFRRFIQKLSDGTTVYYKEWGDPRIIDSRTGQPSSRGLSADHVATEIAYFSKYSPGGAYGTPLWVSAIMDILGAREASFVNLNFFRENTIPAMAILVSGGYLTQETLEGIQDTFTSGRGQDSMHRAVVIEATPDDAGAIDKNPTAPRVDIKPLQGERQTDAQFLEYIKTSKQNVRTSLRLPAIFAGDTEEYTKATAFTSLIVAENQVFSPERIEFDDFINREVLGSYNAVNWKFKSLGPKLIDPEAVSKLMDSLDKMGGLTPNVGIKLANELLGLHIEPIRSEWGDYPFAVARDLMRQGIEAKGLGELVGDTFAPKNTPNIGGGRDTGGDAPGAPVETE